MRCLGGGPITLRLSTGLSAVDARGLSLTAMSFEDVELGPAMMTTRSAGTRVIQLAAATVNRVAKSRCSTTNDMLGSVSAVVKDDQSVVVTKIEPQYIGLVEYLYNLILSE